MKKGVIGNLFENLKEKFINMITSRVFVMMLLMIAVAIVMIHRVFQLQIVEGEQYIDSFQMKIKKERTIAGSRGCIYDRNGNLLAYNELAHSVAIEDVYESGKMKNYNLNTTIHTLIGMIEQNGDHIISDFKITLDKNNHYMFTVEGAQLNRFLADVYGKRNPDDLEEKQRTATAQQVVDYLCGWNKFRIGEYTKEDSSSTFIPGNGYTKEETLKILTIRYDMSSNNYQKYLQQPLLPMSVKKQLRLSWKTTIFWRAFRLSKIRYVNMSTVFILPRLSVIQEKSQMKNWSFFRKKIPLMI